MPSEFRLNDSVDQQSYSSLYDVGGCNINVVLDSEEVD